MIIGLLMQSNSFILEIMIDTKKVGKAIAFLRKRAGFTQANLAERIGISDKAVSKWERGLSLPDVSILGKLSILLDTDTDSLLSGDVFHHDLTWCGLLILNDSPIGINAGTMIYDKPLIDILLSYYLLVGIKRIIISCSEKDNEIIKKMYGDGSFLGISLLYTTNSLLETMDYDAMNYMIIFGRFFLFGVDQTRFFQKAMSVRDRLTILSLPRKTEKRQIYFDENKKVVENTKAKVITQYPYSDIPVLFCPKELLKEALALIICPKCLIPNCRSSLYIEVLDRGFIEIPLDSWEDVSDASQMILLIEKSCGMKIYSIEEIAWRRGIINEGALLRLGTEKKEKNNKDYLLGLIN